MSVEHYVIREVESRKFLISRHAHFGSFESAIAGGVMFNQRKSAEKRVRDMMKSFSGGNGLAYTRYEFWDEDDKPTYYTTDETWSEEEKYYTLLYRPITLEVVPVLITLKDPS